MRSEIFRCNVCQKEIQQGKHLFYTLVEIKDNQDRASMVGVEIKIPPQVDFCDVDLLVVIKKGAEQICEDIRKERQNAEDKG